jgi:hypothetical protein
MKEKQQRKTLNARLGDVIETWGNQTFGNDWNPPAFAHDNLIRMIRDEIHDEGFYLISEMDRKLAREVAVGWPVV